MTKHKSLILIAFVSSMLALTACSQTDAVESNLAVQSAEESQVDTVDESEEAASEENEAETEQETANKTDAETDDSTSTEDQNHTNQDENQSKAADQTPSAELSFEDFKGFYLSFEGTPMQSEPSYTLEIVDGEIRVGWPMSEYIPYQIVDYTIEDQTLYATANEIDGPSQEAVGQKEFIIPLTYEGDTKVLQLDGGPYYAVTEEQYNGLYGI